MWVARTWNKIADDCTQYVPSQLNQGETMKFYDTRNSQ